MSNSFFLVLQQSPSICRSSSLSLLLLLYSQWVFHISISWWSFTRVWVTASLFWSLGLFSISEWSQKCYSLDGLDSSSDFQLFQLFFQVFGGPFQALPLQLVSMSPLCSTAFLVFWQGLSTCLFFFHFYSLVHWDGKIYAMESSLFCCWLSLCLVLWLELSDLFISQNPREFYASHSPGQILVCA